MHCIAISSGDQDESAYMVFRDHHAIVITVGRPKIPLISLGEDVHLNGYPIGSVSCFVVSPAQSRAISNIIIKSLKMHKYPITITNGESFWESLVRSI